MRSTPPAYGVDQYQKLKTFLALPNGIPSHDTFSQLFARLKPEELLKAVWNNDYLKLFLVALIFLRTKC